MLYSHELFLRQLGIRLKQMRKNRGWTLRSMVVDNGFHLTHWQAFENGKGISVPSLLRICAVFDVSFEDLVCGLGVLDARGAELSEKEAQASAPQMAITAHQSKKIAARPKKPISAEVVQSPLRKP